MTKVFTKGCFSTDCWRFLATFTSDSPGAGGADELPTLSPRRLFVWGCIAVASGKDISLPGEFSEWGREPMRVGPQMFIYYRQ
jgi:hypothetical protein